MKNKTITGTISLKKNLILLVFICFIFVVFGINSENFKSDAQVISSGGEKTSSENYTQNVVIGTIAGSSNSSKYNQYLGFWQGGGQSGSEEIIYAPTIDDIENIPSQSITEAGINYVHFYVWASSANGVNRLNDNSLNASFSKNGETTRINASCTHINDINSTTANYSCSIGIWYFDGAGTWSVSSQIVDLWANVSAPYSETFTIQSTASMNLTTSNLAFTGVGLNTKNKTANSPIVIQNFGNAALTGTLNATLLRGITDSTKAIFAENFIVNSTGTGCDGAALANNTKVIIPGLNILKGNFSANAGGIGNISVCLKEVPQNLITQTYSTLNSRAWAVTVSG